MPVRANHSNCILCMFMAAALLLFSALSKADVEVGGGDDDELEFDGAEVTPLGGGGGKRAWPAAAAANGENNAGCGGNPGGNIDCGRTKDDGELNGDEDVVGEEDE